jgi:taspase (threonine aspartase 1)
MTSQDRNTVSSTFYILAAHGGAGFHPPTSDSSLKCSLREAISSALTAFSDATAASGNVPESSALDAATAIIAALEDAPDFNTGYGSNLTFDGGVECDASLMSTEEEAPDRTPPPPPSSSSYSFGSVGAVRGVRNPVLLARRVLEGRRRGHQPAPGLEEETQTRMRMRTMGRVPPLMLVGEGALQFAREQGLRVVDSERSEEGQGQQEMVSPRARREWLVWRERWDRCRRLGGGDSESQDDVRRRHGDVVGVGSAGLGLGSSSPVGETEIEPEFGLGGGGGVHEEDGDVESLRAWQDTVGAVVLVGGVDDVRRQVAAGVSRCVLANPFSSSPLPANPPSVHHHIFTKLFSQRRFVTQALWTRWRGQFTWSVGFDIPHTHTHTRSLVGRMHETRSSVLK